MYILMFYVADTCLPLGKALTGGYQIKRRRLWQHFNEQSRLARQEND